MLTRVAETYPRRGMMVLISDLLVDPDDVQRGLRLLRQRGHDVLVLHVLDDDELDFPFDRPDAVRRPGDDGPAQLQSARALREGYLAALEQFLATVRRDCARDNVDYALIRTSKPLDAALDRILEPPPAREAEQLVSPVNGLASPSTRRSQTVHRSVQELHVIPISHTADDRPAADRRADIDPFDQSAPAAADSLGGDAVS